MLAKWTKILPVPLIKYIAVKYCERIMVNGTTAVRPYKDWIILLSEEDDDKDGT